MVDNGEKQPIFKRISSNVVAMAAVLFTFVTLMGVNSGLHALEARVRVLDEEVRQLKRVEAHIRTLQEDVKEIGTFRNDILEAIQTAISRGGSRDDGPRNKR